VIELRAKEFRSGDAVTSNFGWREYCVASSKELLPVRREIQPLSITLAPLE
jgi:NADPH-dependent curcumin reductase CurA